MKKVFCKYCGEQMIEVPVVNSVFKKVRNIQVRYDPLNMYDFDEKTGKPNKVLVCPVIDKSELEIIDTSRQNRGWFGVQNDYEKGVKFDGDGHFYCYGGQIWRINFSFIKNVYTGPIRLNFY